MNSHGNTKKAPFPAFLSAAIVIFFSTLSAADSIGFVPYFIDGSTPASSKVALSELPVLGEAVPADVAQALLPDHISIPAINLDLPVQNTSSRDTDVLDAALQKGPVRYVDSAQLGQRGNMLIRSSYQADSVGAGSCAALSRAARSRGAFARAEGQTCLAGP